MGAIILILIIVIAVIVTIAAGWRLGGGINDWIDNEADKKKRRRGP
jgi:4-hydroxybenzoate polyprenyltransferase